MSRGSVSEPLCLPVGKSVQLQSFLSHLQGADRHVHADDLLELPILQQFTQEHRAHRVHIEQQTSRAAILRRLVIEDVRCPKLRSKL